MKYKTYEPGEKLDLNGAAVIVITPDEVISVLAPKCAKPEDDVGDNAKCVCALAAFYSAHAAFVQDWFRADFAQHKRECRSKKEN